MGAGPCIGVLKSIREKIGKSAGDTVRVRLWEDEEPRTVDVPEDFGAALDACARARDAYEALSYSHKREYVQWIEGAKKAETRSSRIQKAVQMLIGGSKSHRA